VQIFLKFVEKLCISTRSVQLCVGDDLHAGFIGLVVGSCVSQQPLWYMALGMGCTPVPQCLGVTQPNQLLHVNSRIGFGHDSSTINTDIGVGISSLPNAV